MSEKTTWFEIRCQIAGNSEWFKISLGDLSKDRILEWKEILEARNPKSKFVVVEVTEKPL